MIETIPFSKLEERSGDLFELVVAAAKRTRQINTLRIAKNPLPSINENEEETFEETPDEEEIIDWDKVEKPTTQALKEMLCGKLNYRYAGEDQEEESESEIEE
ncbi:MAG: DNA-directed RNA polymerase subunit omega [Candidatus Neomarinimicrobiota bacterium]|nr:MAG: DNA-directed RNA polymerase subunit omega [Candidatus Neomarinimicrobiota bacterium]